METRGIKALAALWQEGQRAFWSAASGVPPDAEPEVDAAAAWAPAPDAFDGFWTAMAGNVAPPGRGESWRALAAASARYRAVVLAAWGRVREAFEIQRRAMVDPALPPPDWRLMRDRWFALAEAEFIATQRSEDFLDAQRDAVRAVARWRDGLSEPERAQMAAARVGARLAAQLGLEQVRIAQTPKDEIWRSDGGAGQAVLSRYRPLGRRPGLGPLLICYGLIGRQTMTDLAPDRSLVRNLLAAGVDVFVLDWGHPGANEARNGFDHYADTLLGQAIEGVRAASGAPRVVLFGICQGGTFAACHAARHAADSRTLAGLILAVTPVDFHADGEDADPAHGLLNLWVRSLDEADLEALVGPDGTLSGELMGLVFNQLNPVRTLAKYAVELPEAARDPQALATFLAMEKWLADRPDLPGALARDWLVGLYRRNALVAGRFAPGGGAPVTLGRIGVPVLNVYAAGDHIIPPPCSRALGRHVEARLYRELSLPTGHVGVFVSARAQALLAPALVAWMRGLVA